MCFQSQNVNEQQYEFHAKPLHDDILPSGNRLFQTARRSDTFNLMAWMRTAAPKPGRSLTTPPRNPSLALMRVSVVVYPKAAQPMAKMMQGM
jgi:hypothetical protein